MGRQSTHAQSEAGSAVQEVCDQFLTQVRAQLPLERLAVVLLDSQQETGRVVFSWKVLHRAQPALAAATLGTGETRTGSELQRPYVGMGELGAGWAVRALVISPDRAPAGQQSISVALRGSQEVLGAALLHAPAAEPYGITEQRQARRLAEPLALTLDNLRLQQRLLRRAEEADALRQIACVTASTSAIGQVYRRFAAQVQRLAEYHHLAIYLVDWDTDRLTCPFHTGVGARRPGPGPTTTVPASEWLSTAARGKGFIEKGLEAFEPSGQAWGAIGVGARSALTVPVVCSGKVLGAARLGHRRADAYQPHHLELVQGAVNLLGPAVACSQLGARLAGQSDSDGKIARAHRALVSNQDLEAAWPDFARSLEALLPLDWAMLSWDGAAGPHWHNMVAHAAGSEVRVGDPPPPAAFTISARLILGQQVVATLTLGRSQPAFAAAEQALVQQVADRIAPAVQSHLYYRQTRRQAYQLEQLQRSQLDRRQSGQTDAPDRDLLVDAAHALRSPLTAIKGYSSSLLQPDLTWPPEVQTEFLKTIRQESDRLERVVRDLLEPAAVSSQPSAIPIPRRDRAGADS